MITTEQAIEKLREDAECDGNRLSHRLVDTVEREVCKKRAKLANIPTDEQVPVGPTDEQAPVNNRALWAIVTILGVVTLGDKIPGELLWPLLDKVQMLFP